MNARALHVPRWVERAFPLIVLVVGLLAIAAGTDLLAGRVFQRVVTVMFINVILVVALQIFTGNSGLMSFAHVAFMAIGAYGSIWFSLSSQEKRLTLPDMPESWFLHQVHLPFIPALIAAGLVAAAVGAVLGVPLLRLRDASFTIASFAWLIIVHSVALQWDELTRGSRTVFGIPQYTGLWTATGWMLLFVALAFLFREMPLGLKLRAARDDEAAAWSIGISSAWVRWVAWVFSVFVTAVAGGLWAHFITTFSPNSFYLRQTFLIVAMLIIGGSGSVSGAVIGAVAVSLTSEALRSVENWLNLQRAAQTALGQVIPFQLVGFTEIVIALAMIAVLILRPSGLTRGREIRWPFGPKLDRPAAVEPTPERAG